MKRARELKPLSEEHHLALVLARAAKRAADIEGPLDETWRRISAEYEQQLAPHFRVEEDMLVPPLRELGEYEMVDRLLEDHRKLKAFIESPVHSATALRAFGELLDQHVRYEEREVFERAQQILSPADLARVFEAYQNQKPPHD
jgi:hypothetical protein